MWQSQVEIEHYSVAYFARIAVFKALLHGASVKGWAHALGKLIHTCHVYTERISPALNGISALQRF